MGEWLHRRIAQSTRVLVSLAEKESAAWRLRRRSRDGDERVVLLAVQSPGCL
ncbi:MAG: hypothetical protein ABI281_08955 [Caldimonas sp.]